MWRNRFGSNVRIIDLADRLGVSPNEEPGMTTLTNVPVSQFGDIPDAPLRDVACMSCNERLRVREGWLPLCAGCASLVFDQGLHAQTAAWSWFAVVGYRSWGK